MNRSDDECYHGLVARTYDLFRGDDPVEPQPWFQFYKRRLDERPGLALEPACGTGRILLPFLKSGYAMEGVDSSAEMLALCRQKAEAMGVKATLYQQYMQELELPQRYTTILIPLGSFILIGQRQEALQALKRFHAHLAPGGQLVFSMPAPSPNDYAPPSEQNQVWSEPTPLTDPATGDRITLTSLNRSDRLEQTHTSRQRYQLHSKEGVLLKTEEHLCVTRWYGKYEMIMMLEHAGFRNVTVYGNHTDEEANAESWARVYWAERER